MFSVDLTNKEKIAIWTQYLQKFKVCGLSLALKSLHYSND